MINWFLKKRGLVGTAAVPAPSTAAKPAPAPRAAAPTPKAPPPPPAPAIDWSPRLQAALGDDIALLQLAQEATVLDIKLASIAALSDEAALKQAEKAFRSHDRKVHRLAKQRLEAAVTQRESRAKAQVLLQRTQGLLAEAELAVNHLVELDREWQALPEPVLEPTQREQFAALRAQLGRQLQAHADAQQASKQWRTAARGLLAEWLPALRQAAITGTARDALHWSERLQQAAATQPAAGAAELSASLATAQQTAASVQAWLEILDAPPPEGAAELAWPAELLHPDAELNASLRQRQSQWLQLHRPPPPVIPQVAATAAKKAKPAKPAAMSDEQRQVLQDLLQQAEAARDEGQLGEMQRLLQSVESSLVASGAALPERLRARQQALWAEQGRLRDWQQWGGERARDDLIAQAEALERLTLGAAPAASVTAATAAATTATTSVATAAAAADGTTSTSSDEEGTMPVAATATASLVELAAEPPADTPPAAPPARTPKAAPTLKLNLQTHANAIRDLRQRWKALDRVGAPASQAQWKRFDEALTIAHRPVADQQAAMQAQRLQNLAARETLLNALESHELADAAGNSAAADWRAGVRELDRFQAEWRKLGPLEHTVPRASVNAVQQRLQAALARIEVPLQAARAAAAASREQLINEAEALVPRDGGTPLPDAARVLRELQLQWQDQARRLPLPRGLENALWTRFKSATDAVFAQRDAAFAARDAELAANLAHAQSLVQRLLDLGPEVPPAEIEKTLGEVDRAWRQGGELPRGALDGLEQRYRKAREAAARQIGAAVRQRWQAQCGALLEKLALCEAREAREGAAPELPASAESEARWAALPPLPTGWEEALRERFAGQPIPAAAAAAQVDEYLLRLEMALGMPADPAWQAQRQALKLRALKDTMEGRGTPQDGPAQQAAWLRTVLRQPGLDVTQRGRLQHLLQALREAEPGSLGATTGAR